MRNIYYKIAGETFYVFGEEKGRKKERKVGGKIYMYIQREKREERGNFLESIPLCAFIRLTRKYIYKKHLFRENKHFILVLFMRTINHV